MTPRAISIARGAVEICTPLDERANLSGDLAGDRQPFLRRPSGGIRTPHPLEHRVGNAYTRHFVRHEFGVPRALERQDAGEDRDLVRRDAREKGFQLRDIEHRLGHCELGPCLDLVREAAQLFLQVRAPPG